MPKISICTPVHNMKNKDFFLSRLQKSLEDQTFTDFEWVVTEEGKMAENTNAAIKKAKGEIIKIIYLDDYLAHKNSLKNIVENWKGGWLVTGCNHDNRKNKFSDHIPTVNGLPFDINTIGSPSVLAFENKNPLLFDENLSWLLDVDLYKRLYKQYGEPTIIESTDVTIGLHDGQMTNLLTPEEKQKEADYLTTKKI